MDAIAIKNTGDDRIEVPTARIGLVIPSVNRLTEPQFTHFAPARSGHPCDAHSDRRQMA